jgi:O-antigen ligase
VGWIGILLIVVYGLVEFLGHFLVNKKFTRQNAKFFIYFICGTLICAVAIIYIVNNPDRFDFLFQGTGLFDTSDSSFSIRFERSIQTFKVFLDKPSNIILGAGPGGVGAYMVNHPEIFQITTSSFKQLWGTEPNTVFIEILASVGITGFLVFSWFLINIFRRLWKLYKNNDLLKQYRIICLALFWGLALELFILQFNQNYLRPYLWLHIGISIAAVNTLEQTLKGEDKVVRDESSA